MKIAIFGLGYVGVVTAACLSEDGHEVVGVDVSATKVELINSGQSPIIEDQISEIVAENVRSGRLRATEDAKCGVDNAEIVIVCVGTPSKQDGSLELGYVSQVVGQIGDALKERETPIMIVLRSTMIPGTMRDLVIPKLEEHSGKKAGKDFFVFFHPEFLREGTSVFDYYNPPKIVVGECNPGEGKLLMKIYGDKYEAPRIFCPVEVAEMVKYCDNLFHAVKITFANEIGQFCNSLGIDSQGVMKIFCQDRKLNISSSYLMPGFAFGGSCLPKDARAFLSVARNKALPLPMLEGVLASNRVQIERAVSMILATGYNRIGFHGIAFKSGTDDLRESPFVELAERLLGKGRKLIVFDKYVDLSRLVGRNKSYIESVLPHLSDIVTGDSSALAGAELILICHKATQEEVQSWRDAGAKVLDLTGAFSAQATNGMMCIV